MWDCPKCQSEVDDSFEICWSCGTTPEGVEDPTFETADESEPILDPPSDLDLDLEADDPTAELAGTPWPDLVACFEASNPIEAKFIADQLIESGIPAIADHHDINMVLGGFRPSLWGCGPRVRVRSEDLPKASAWIEAYQKYRKSKSE